LVYLPQDILTKVDRASMAKGLEVRAPFLDRRVVELAFGLPIAWHRNALAGKRMLRRAFGDLLPSRIWQRRKQGFSVPVHAWFKGELGETLLSRLQTSPGALSPNHVESMLKEHRDGRRDHGLRLWSLHALLIKDAGA
jgi:asparagine synthase (glutamine-hydrolysing)